MNTDGIIYVDTGEHVSVGISHVQPADQSRTDVFVRIYDRPEVCSVGKDSADQKADRHACKQHSAQFIIILSVCKEKVQNRCCHIDKPKQVRDNKILAERNIIINRKVHNVIIACNCLLQVEEPAQINENICHYPAMTVFFKKILHYYGPSFGILSCFGSITE